MNSKEYKFSDGRTAVFEYDENGIGKITLECMDALMDRIPQWIPCTERLPETDRQVIVQTKHGLITDGRWTGDTWFTTNDYTCYGVVAWMPLPEPWNTNGA